MVFKTVVFESSFDKIIVMSEIDISDVSYETSTSWLNDIELLEDYFYFNSQKIDYKRVKKISYSAERTIGAYAPSEFAFDIFLDSNKTFHQEIKHSSRVKDILKFGYGGVGASVYAELWIIYKVLLSKTFSFRVEKYEKIFRDSKLWWLGDERGYDIYISEDGKIYKDKIFWEYFHKIDMYDTGPYDIVLKKNSSSIISNFKNQFSNDDIERVVIFLNYDADIRRYILEQKLHFEIGEPRNLF